MRTSSSLSSATAARTIIESSAIPVRTVVIGAGVIGLAVARALSLQNNDDEILILDRASYIGSETSSRNSEVIHAGLYYPSSSLKARLCVRGRELIYDYCQQRNVDHQKIGKLIVATNSKQLQTELPALQQKTISNGVNDIKLLSVDDAKYMEPNIDNIYGALWSPSTGIVDSHNFMLSLLADAENNGATLSLRTSVTNACIMNNDNDNDNNRILLQCCSSTSCDGGGGNNNIDDNNDDSSTTWLACERVINCAGLWSDRIASMIHSDSNNNYIPPKQYYAKGNYFKLQGCKAPFNHLIYPVPEVGGLGIHATIDINGQTKFGPDVEWLSPDTHPDDIDWKVDMNRSQSFYTAIQRYWPNIPTTNDSLVPDYSGARPKLLHPASNNNKLLPLPFQDFQIVGPQVHGVPGLIHMFGIESPGLTSSMAIGEYVMELLQQDNREEKD